MRRKWRDPHIPWVNFEAGAAWLAKKAVVPVCFGDLLKEKLPKPYSGIMTLALPDEADYLLQSVAHHLHLVPPEPIGEGDQAFIRLRSALADV